MGGFSRPATSWSTIATLPLRRLLRVVSRVRVGFRCSIPGLLKRLLRVHAVLGGIFENLGRGRIGLVGRFLKLRLVRLATAGGEQNGR